MSFAGDGDESDELWLSGGDKFVAEAFELRVVTRSDHNADEAESCVRSCGLRQ